ncbi:MAG: NYN domain-containing protein [Nitrospinota bacterium]
MGSVAVFLDGGYIDKVLYYDFANARIDFEKLAKEISSPDELLRAYYYHCLPYLGNPPTEEEKSRYASKHGFITALNHLPRFQVRLGQLAFRGGEYIQKRVDCMVGVDMALLAGKGKIHRAALFSGDSDLLPAVEAVKREGVLVTLWHGSFSRDTSPSRELFEICDERFQLTSEILQRIKRPTPN